MKCRGRTASTRSSGPASRSGFDRPRSPVVQAPQDVASLAALLAQANDVAHAALSQGRGHEIRVVGRGAESAAILSTTALAPVLDHCAGDLTATVGAG